jgi:type II secretory pathway component PulF
MAQDVRKTLVVLSQIKTALEVGLREMDAMCIAMESPSVSGLFSAELIKTVIDKLESGEKIGETLSRLDILSEYDQTLLQVGSDGCYLEKAIDNIIGQHMFIRSLGV